MKRAFWLTLVALLAFAAILLARLPASWMLPLARRAHAGCASIEGTLWSGACGGLTVNGAALGDLTWDLHALALLRLRLAAAVSLLGPAAHGSAELEASAGGALRAHAVRADLTLEPRLLPGLPANLHGTAHAELARLALDELGLREIEGRIEARDLEERSGENTLLGSYEVRFPGGGALTGAVRDLGGPLEVSGTLHLSAEGFELQGQVAARRSASAELTDGLRFLGTPDAAGRRTFDISGSF
ncbi:MAG: type II secretion system protein N [Gammaproteobacteria bacterium]|nr:type II secretion system protein N [Gammaproteobacteria bacterium]